MNTDNKSRRARVRLATQTEILDGARKQMAAEGAAALSLRAIASEMGMTAPALYRYFASRDELVTALIVDAFTSLGDALQRAQDEHADESHANRLLAILLAYRAWALAHPQDYALIFGTPIPGYVAPTEKTLPPAARGLDLIAAQLASALGKGEARLVPAYAKPLPGVQKQLIQWKKEYGLALPTAALHLALIAWTRVHGLTSLELYQLIPPSIQDPGELYRSEILVLLGQMGMSPIK